MAKLLLVCYALSQILFYSSLSFATNKKEEVKPTFNLPPEYILRMYREQREDENWSWLQYGSQQKDSWDHWKYIPINDSFYITTGGEARVQFESIENPNWNLVDSSKLSYFLNRFRFHTDIANNDGAFRLFVGLQVTERNGENDEPRPSIDETGIDLQSLFIDYKPAENLRIRLGRQELGFGIGRLISPRAGPINTRVPQDGIRITSTFGKASLDIFDVNVVEIEDGSFDDGSNSSHELFGLYWTSANPYQSPFGYELYAFRSDKKFAPYFSIAGSEERSTYGVRGWFKTGKWNHDIEINQQKGSINSNDIDAWSFSTSSKITFDDQIKSTLEFSTGLNSGDDEAFDNELNTFSAPLVRGSYFGQFAPFGPSNMKGFGLGYSFQLMKSFELGVKGYKFWRENVNDGIYGVAGFPSLPPANNNSFVGNQYEIWFDVSLGTHTDLLFRISRFSRGDYLTFSPTSEDINSLGASITYKF